MSHQQSGNMGGYGHNQGLPPRPPQPAPWASRKNSMMSQGIYSGGQQPHGPPPSGAPSWGQMPPHPPGYPYGGVSTYNMPPPPVHLPADFTRLLARGTPILENHIIPGAAYVAPVQLQVGHSYGLWRGNGQYTRLIPADMIQYMSPADRQACNTYQGPDGLIVLPHPTAPTPQIRASQGRNLLVPVDVRA
jgi:hypothetical protein